MSEKKKKGFITLGNTKFSKFLNSLVLIGILIYVAGKLGFSPDVAIETVKKVEIGNEIHLEMSKQEIESSLSYFFYNQSSLNSIKPAEVRDSINIDYVLNEAGQVKTIELITTLTTLDARNSVNKIHKELNGYVEGSMLQLHVAPKTIKHVTFSESVVEKLTNDEIQTMLSDFFESSSVFSKLDSASTSENLEFKFIVDNDGQIWQMELISTLPSEQAEAQLLPIYNALNDFSKTKLIEAVKTKEAG